MTVLSEKLYRTHFSKVPLQPTQTILTDYSGNELKRLGEISVSVSYGQQKANLSAIVVQGDRPALLGRNWLQNIKLDWHSIFKVSDLNVDYLLSKYESVFSNTAGTIKGFKADLRLERGAKPVFCKSRPVPFAMRSAVENELDRLEEMGTMYRVTQSRWASPTVNVRKSDGTIRICGDYKVSLNRFLDVDKYPLPTTEDIFATLAGGKYFTKLDLSNAYQQLELEDDARELLTVNTHRGLYRYRRLNYGVASATAIFQSTMDKILQGIPRTCCYLDDILISARSVAEHNEILEQVFARLLQYGVKVKKPKCQFAQSSVTYLGHVIDVDGVHPTSEKVEAIMNAPSPKNVDELRAWLGMLNYYGRFLNNLSTMLQPLNNLLKKEVAWEWSSECEAAFKSSKEALSSSRLLVHFDSRKPIVLACDASQYGLGAVISHVMDDGSEQPIAFASRTLSASEKNYSQLEKEALAIIFGVKKFHKYLYGTTFQLVTDHKPLTTILGPKTGVPTMAASRLQRWAIILAAYRYEIVYKRSSENSNADAMSRVVAGTAEECSDTKVFKVSSIDELPIEAKDIAKETQRDTVLSKVYDFVINGWPSSITDPELLPFFRQQNELSADQQCVIRGMRVVIPKIYQENMLDELHKEHQGISRTRALARSYMWWPKMDTDIEKLIQGCSACQTVARSPPKAPLHPWPWTSRVFQRVHVDFGEFEKQQLFVLVDVHSGWIEVAPMNSTTAEKTIEVLRSIFGRFGFPEELVSDNGPQFKSDEFQAFMLRCGIKHTLIPPYHPATNGAAERAVGTVKAALAKQMFDASKAHTTLRQRLDSFLLTYRNTPKAALNQSPAEVFLKRKLRTRLTLLKPNNAKFIEDKQRKEKQHYDRGTVMREFVKDDQVRVKNHQGGKMKWILGRVIRRLGPLNYLVRVDGRTRYVHVEHLRAAREEGNDSDDETNIAETTLLPELSHLPTITIPHLPVSESASGMIQSTVHPDVATEVSSHIESTDVSRDTPEQDVQCNERRYPVRSRKPVVRLDL